MCGPMRVCVCVHMQWGQTPVSIAAEKGHVEVVRALLAAGADKEAATTLVRAEYQMSVCMEGHAGLACVVE